MNKNFKTALLLLLSLTPLVILRGINNPFDLPKLVWIFIATFLLLNINIKEKLFSMRNTFIIPALLILFWNLFTLQRCINVYAGMYAILILLLFITLYASLENLIAQDTGRIKTFFNYILIVSVVISLYGILQVAGIDPLRWTFKNTPLSTLGRRNFAGEYLVMIIPYLYSLIALKDKKKVFSVPLLILFITHLVFTFTRASYIGFFFSSLLFIGLAGIKKLPAGKTAVILIGLLILSQPSFSAVSTFEKGTVKSRFRIWDISLKMIKDNPLMGVGPENFSITYPEYAAKYPEGMLASHRVSHAHNDYLETTVETGIPGLLLFLYMLFTVARTSFFVYRKVSDREKKILTAGISASILAICVNALASFPFKNAVTSMLFWVNLAFIGALYREVTTTRPLKIPYKALSIYLTVFVITGLTLSYRGVKASRYIYKAKNPARYGDPLQMAEKSLQHNPLSFENTFTTAKIAIDRGLYQQAYKHLLMAKELQPYYYGTYDNLGIAYFRTGHYEEAERSYLESLRLNPHMPEPHNNIASIYIETGRYDEAITHLEKAISLRPAFYLAAFNMGMAYYLKEDYKEAEEYFTRTLEINPSFQPAREYLEKLSHASLIP
jgi:putative inorganic carbon (hco3(-)) transporter